jgi:hypothetical protein
MHLFLKFILGMKIYMFQRVPLSIIRSFHCKQSNGIRHTDLLTACEVDPEPARKLSANLYDIYHCGLHSGKLLMVDRGTVRNMWTFIPRINLRN